LQNYLKVNFNNNNNNFINDDKIQKQEREVKNIHAFRNNEQAWAQTNFMEACEQK
jgi:hypothetical protein